MTWIVMPGMTNEHGTIFGGQVMAWIDVCAAVSAKRFSRAAVVTVSMDGLTFLNPIHNGEVAVLQSQVNWAGRTSMEVGVRVEAEDPLTGARHHTASAYLTFVAIDADGRPRPIGRALAPETPEERRRHEDAEVRRRRRLAAREEDERRRGGQA